jgi:hypothetical protein
MKHGCAALGHRALPTALRSGSRGGTQGYRTCVLSATVRESGGLDGPLTKPAGTVGTDCVQHLACFFGARSSLVCSALSTTSCRQPALPSTQSSTQSSTVSIHRVLPPASTHARTYRGVVARCHELSSAASTCAIFLYVVHLPA